MRILVPLFTLCFAVLSLSGQSVMYVNQHASGSLQDGQSWSTAFKNLQDALGAAQYGDTIWVASGIYLPTEAADRDKSFLLKNGVKMYGGFQGSEVQLEQRDIALYPCILSGNIGDTSLASDNSKHVVRGYGLDEKTTLDGFTISGGYSLGSFDQQSDPYGAGLFLIGSVDLPNSKPNITNCIFEFERVHIFFLENWYELQSQRQAILPL